jgi:hypothetical protein
VTGPMVSHAGDNPAGPVSVVPEHLRLPFRADLVAAFEARRQREGTAVLDYGVLLVAVRE